jgi:hypothetical protein
MEKTRETKSFLTVKQAAEKYPAFGERALRYLIFTRSRNGLAPAVRKVGKKVLLDESAFVAWIERGAMPERVGEAA